MTRPIDPPDWATDANYADPGKDWDALPTKVKPSAGEIGQGNIPGRGFAYDKDNWLKNNHGLWIKHNSDALFDSGFYFADDFMGDNVAGAPPDANKWKAATGLCTIVDDAANDGFGAVQILGTAGTPISTLQTGAQIPLGTRDFYFEVRVRVSSFGSGEIWAGFFDTGTNDAFLIYTNNTIGNWKAVYGIGGAGVHDLGVPCAPTTYKVMRVYRVAGTLYYEIDNSGVLFSIANADNFPIATRFQLHSKWIAGANASAVFDNVKLWVAR